MTATETIRFFIVELTSYVSPVAVAAEWVLMALAAALIVLTPIGRARWLLAIRNAFLHIANRKRLSIVLCGTLPVALRLALLPILPVPDPSIHDEFSHLLLADTLAHGRLTNPTHPMWKHFESIHIIQQPTYNSMYPPAQGAVLALGQVLTGEPWSGVAIGVGLMFAAMCWMMQGWLPPAWALFGTLIAILKIGILGLWMNSYLGGAVPALGGALLIGAAPRLRREGSNRFHACVFAMGMVILMNSRPFDGALLSVAAVAYIAPALWRRPNRMAAIVPAAIVLACGTLFTGYYCWRVTGSPLRMAYQVNRDTYGWPENLGFLPAKKLTLRHRVLQDMYAKEIQHRDIYKKWDALFENLNTRFFNNWTYFIGPLLTVPLLWGFRERRTRPLAIFLALIAGLNLLQMVLYPYHLAPVVPILFALAAAGSRQIYVSLYRNRRGVCFAIVLPFCLILIGAMKQQAEPLGIPLSYWERAFEPQRDVRASLEAWLAARPRKQLVIVRYSPNHSPDQEWVYNHADIDGSKVVWAREMDVASNEKLLAYFADRDAWLLQADVYPQRVVAYPVSASASPTSPVRLPEPSALSQP
jgi:hypothetical protein